jgi:hypothetical protein
MGRLAGVARRGTIWAAVIAAFVALLGALIANWGKLPNDALSLRVDADFSNILLVCSGLDNYSTDF